MRSSSYRGIAGNAKLRGKKTVVLECRCCDLFNFKFKYREQLDKKEIREFGTSP